MSPFSIVAEGGGTGPGGGGGGGGEGVLVKPRMLPCYQLFYL